MSTLKYIEIQLPKSKIYLTQKEILSLLTKDMDLYKQGLIRGKAIIRNQRQIARENNLLN